MLIILVTNWPNNAKSNAIIISMMLCSFIVSYTLFVKLVVTPMLHNFKLFLLILLHLCLFIQAAKPYYAKSIPY